MSRHVRTPRRGRLTRCAALLQVVRVDSPDRVTIRILPDGPTYKSDVKRLRKPALDVTELKNKFTSKFADFAKDAGRLNPHAAPGTPLHTRFALAAAESKDTKVVDIMLHGTRDENVDSILKASLRGRPGCGTSWFTDMYDTAMKYVGEERGLIAFAVLRD